ncbi:type VI secretion system accessory protein TagJ [Bremerella sp. JC817]|uniref:type VI secretion system accessory protein TagJ n=1 Tax=Bremerella sp. JC817 TaxID=3231756 RepID=UPI0034588546
MTIGEKLKNGQLDDAIDEAIADVKKQPMQWDLRIAMAQLLCLRGDLQRADGHLETAQIQTPDAILRISMYRQMIRGEMTRNECWDDGRTPDLMQGQEPTPLIEKNLRLLLALRDGNLSEAATLAGEIEEERPLVKGTCDGVPFEDLRDQDDRTAFFFETITSNGKYFWIPFDEIESIEFHPPEQPSDLIWRRATMSAYGQEGDVFLNALYPGSSQSDDLTQKLGQSTDWLGQEGEPGRGLGQRMFWLGEDEKSIMEISTLTFSK